MAGASLLATTVVAAQGIRPQLGVGAAVAMPMGDYRSAARGQGFKNGFQGLALVAFTVPGWPVGLRADASYGMNSANDQLKADLTTAFGQPTDEKTKLLGANVAVTYPFRPDARLQPYVLAGVGAYRVTVSVTSGGSTADNSATKFAWSLGAGTLYRVPRVTLFVEARFVDVAAVSQFPRTTFLAVTTGVRLGGL